MFLVHGVRAAARFAVIASLIVAPAAAAERKLNRSVDSGKETVIARATFWTQQCQPRSFTLTITKAPTNGAARITEGKNKIAPNPQFGQESCVGQNVAGRQILYQSKPGFHGGDTLVYELVSDKGEHLLTTIEIKVK